MHIQLLLCILSGTAAILFGISEILFPAMLFFAYPVSYYWVRRRQFIALGIPGVAFLSASFISGNYLLALVLIMTLTPGIVLGILLAKRYSIGICITAVTLLIFLFSGGNSALMWDSVWNNWHNFFQVYKTQISESNVSGSNESVLVMIDWLDLNWVHVFFGLLFGCILLSQTLFVSLLFLRFRKEGALKVSKSTFSGMRTPEAVVWIAILAAAGWFWDKQYPNDALRFLVWNGSIVLVFVYWVNGLSILVYAVQKYHIRPLTALFFIATAVLLSVHHVFSVIGFFDTWINFRDKIDKMQQRRLEQESREL